jgi:hypothetical protein
VGVLVAVTVGAFADGSFLSLRMSSYPWLARAATSQHGLSCQVATVRVVELFCSERWNRNADGFGSRADNFDSIVATESPSSPASEVGRLRCHCGGGAAAYLANTH